jgi:hypothetical protein
LTENTFPFTATTWGIVTGERKGDEEANWKLTAFTTPHIYLVGVE